MLCTSACVLRSLQPSARHSTPKPRVFKVRSSIAPPWLSLHTHLAYTMQPLLPAPQAPKLPSLWALAVVLGGDGQVALGDGELVALLLVLAGVLVPVQLPLRSGHGRPSRQPSATRCVQRATTSKPRQRAGKTVQARHYTVHMMWHNV